MSVLTGMFSSERLSLLKCRRWVQGGKQPLCWNVLKQGIDSLLVSDLSALRHLHCAFQSMNQHKWWELAIAPTGRKLDGWNMPRHCDHDANDSQVCHLSCECSFLMCDMQLCISEYKPVCVCVCVSLHPSCMTYRLLCRPMEVTHLFFFCIPCKILSTVWSIPLLPQHTHKHLHTYTLASFAIDFGIHCCHGNGLEHAHSHRLFFSIALYRSLCRGRPASLVWQGARFLPSALGYGCLFVYSNTYYHRHVENIVCVGDASVQEHPLVSKPMSRYLIISILSPSFSHSFKSSFVLLPFLSLLSFALYPPPPLSFYSQ